MSGTLYIIAAPSGAGKTSLVRALLEREPGISLSVSYTSRMPRSNEVEGQHYHFVSREVFEHMARAGAFFEYADVHGDYKGTAREAVEPLLASGRDVLLVEDIVDTGRTFSKVIRMMRNRNPRSLNICTFLNKPAARIVDIDIDFCGVDIPNEFAVGYGLDYAQGYRQLPYVGVLDPDSAK